MRPRAMKALLRLAYCLGGVLSGESSLDARVGPWEMPPRRAIRWLGGSCDWEAPAVLRPSVEEAPPRRAVCFFSGVAEGMLAVEALEEEALEVEALEEEALEAEAFLVVFLVVMVVMVVVVTVVMIFAFLEGPASSSAFLLAPAVFAGVEVEALDAFLASRSFFVHSFFSLASILVTSAGTLRPPAFTASSNRMRATDLVFDGWSP